jgi:hypothetical protein
MESSRCFWKSTNTQRQCYLAVYKILLLTTGDVNRMVLIWKSSTTMDPGEVAPETDVPRQLAFLSYVWTAMVYASFQNCARLIFLMFLCIVIGMGVKEGGGGWLPYQIGAPEAPTRNFYGGSDWYQKCHLNPVKYNCFSYAWPLCA